MIPSLDDRLDSVARALQEVVLPALPPGRALAVEQIHLALAHIGIVRQQLDGALAYEKREAEATLALGEDLLKFADGEILTTTAASNLRDALAEASFKDAGAVRRANQAVGFAIENLIQASAEDGSETFRARSFEVVLAAGQQAAIVNRRWNRAVGFEASESIL